MKKLVPFILSIVIPFIGFSQISDSVSIGSSKEFQTYYSLENGEVKQSSSDWDLAFVVKSTSVAIRTNDGHSVEVYLYQNGNISDWSNVDTTGLSTWTQLRNDENDWTESALSNSTSTWGTYNQATHNVIGDKLYIIQTKASALKKLKIEGMYNNTSNTFEFSYANIDGSNEVNVVIAKKDYSSKNFIYYSIDHDSIMDLEPMVSDWDLVFNKYSGLVAPNMYYGLTGIQTNIDRTTAQVENMPVDSADWTTATYVDDIATIGSDWKSYNWGSGGYDITDSLTYFVESDMAVWQITMTGFERMSSTFYFNKTKVLSVGIADFNVGLNTVNVFPNPASENINISIESTEIQNNLEITIFSITGNVVYSQMVNVANLTNITIPVSDWNGGVYLVRIGNDSNSIVKQLVIQ